MNKPDPEFDAEQQFQEEWLSAYLDGELNPEQRALVEQRLQYDSNAQMMLVDLQKVRSLVSELPAWPNSSVDVGQIINGAPAENDHGTNPSTVTDLAEDDDLQRHFDAVVEGDWDEEDEFESTDPAAESSDTDSDIAGEPTDLAKAPTVPADTDIDTDNGNIADAQAETSAALTPDQTSEQLAEGSEAEDTSIQLSPQDDRESSLVVDQQTPAAVEEVNESQAGSVAEWDEPSAAADDEEPAAPIDASREEDFTHDGEASSNVALQSEAAVENVSDSTAEADGASEIEAESESDAIDFETSEADGPGASMGPGAWQEVDDESALQQVAAAEEPTGPLHQGRPQSDDDGYPTEPELPENLSLGSVSEELPPETLVQPAARSSQDHAKRLLSTGWLVSIAASLIVMTAIGYGLWGGADGPYFEMAQRQSDDSGASDLSGPPQANMTAGESLDRRELLSRSQAESVDGVALERAEGALTQESASRSASGLPEASAARGLPGAFGGGAMRSAAADTEEEELPMPESTADLALDLPAPAAGQMDETPADSDPGSQELADSDPGSQMQFADSDPASQVQVTDSALSSREVAEPAPQSQAQMADAAPGSQELADSDPGSQMQFADSDPASQELADSDPGSQMQFADSDPASQELADSDPASQVQVTDSALSSREVAEPAPQSQAQMADAAPGSQELADAAPGSQELADSELSSQAAAQALSLPPPSLDLSMANEGSGELQMPALPPLELPEETSQAALGSADDADAGIAGRLPDLPLADEALDGEGATGGAANSGADFTVDAEADQTLTLPPDAAPLLAESVPTESEVGDANAAERGRTGAARSRRSALRAGDSLHDERLLALADSQWEESEVDSAMAKAALFLQHPTRPVAGPNLVFAVSTLDRDEIDAIYQRLSVQQQYWSIPGSMVDPLLSTLESAEQRAENAEQSIPGRALTQPEDDDSLPAPNSVEATPTSIEPSSRTQLLVLLGTRAGLEDLLANGFLDGSEARNRKRVTAMWFLGAADSEGQQVPAALLLKAK